MEDLQRYDDALALIERALPLFHYPLDMQLQRVHLIQAARGMDAAVESLRELANQKPDDATVLATLAEWLNEQGQSDLAVEHARAALAVGAETLSRIVDWTDRGTCVLFGDGAGAVVLEASDEPGILSTHLHADGQFKELLTVPAGLSENYAQFLEGKIFVQMKGNEVFKMAVNTLARIVDETLEANGMQKSDVNWLVPHQANIRIIQATAKKLDMPMDHVVVTVDEHGNTSAASIPLALDIAVRDGRIVRGDTVFLEAFGGGFTWGSALLKM